MLIENTNPVQYPTSSAHPFMLVARLRRNDPNISGKRRVDELSEQDAVVASFVNWVNGLGPLSHASSALKARVLDRVAALALHIDARAEKGADSGYGRHVLYEDPERWSVAAVVLRPGQSTECHDHGGWGCAVTVQGVERNRRFVHDASDTLVFSDEADYPQGQGYVFDAIDVHQPLGADPNRVTVALHFLVHERANGAHAQAHAEQLAQQPSLKHAA